MPAVAPFCRRPRSGLSCEQFLEADIANIAITMPRDIAKGLEVTRPVSNFWRLILLILPLFCHCLAKGLKGARPVSSFWRLMSWAPARGWE